MVRPLLSFLLLLGFASCAEDEDILISSGLIGTWELTAVYADPGDGSGTYQPVASAKLVAFRSDGTYQSNGSYCAELNSADEDSRGRYSLESRTLDPNCDAYRLLPFVQRGDTLDILFSCIEGCGERYRKVSNAETL